MEKKRKKKKKKKKNKFFSAKDSRYEKHNFTLYRQFLYKLAILKLL